MTVPNPHLKPSNIVKKFIDVCLSTFINIHGFNLINNFICSFIFSEMDDAKRRAQIKLQVAKRKESSEPIPKGTAP